MIDELLAERLLREAGDEVHVSATNPDEVLRAGRGSSRARALGLAAAACIVAVVAGVAFSNGGGDRQGGPAEQPPRVTAVVPSVLGMEVAAARADLEDAGFSVLVSEDVRCGDSGVAGQDPAPGTAVRSGAAVLLYLFVGECPDTGPKGSAAESGAMTALRKAQATAMLVQIGSGDLGSVELAPRVTLSGDISNATILTGPNRFDADAWVLASHSLVDVLSSDRMQPHEGQRVNCVGYPEALPQGETQSPAVTLVKPVDGDSCLGWAAVDTWLDAQGRIRRVHLRLWEY